MKNEAKIIKTIYETYEKMIHLSNDLNLMQQTYNSKMLDKNKEYEGEFYNEMQYKEIMEGLDEGIDVSLYASPDLSYMSMSMIRAAISSGADVTEIVYDYKKFDEKQIALLCSAAVSGLYDVAKIAYPHLDADRMLARITGDYIRADMPDMTVSVEDMKEYGYMSDEMLPLRPAAAFVYYNENLPVMLLYPNGTEAYPDSMDDMERHVEHSGMFGIEKYVWEHELNKADAKQYDDMTVFADIVHNGSTYYAIYQIRDEADERLNILLRNKEDIDRRGISVVFDNYKLVYAAKTDKLPELESIYMQFNTTYADGFYGHSLSVSDVIVMKDGTDTKAYYVDSVGFQEVPGFALQFMEENLINGFDDFIGEEVVSAISENIVDTDVPENKEKTFAEQVDEVLAGISNQYNALKVCDTPDILIQVGCEQLPILYTQSHLKEAIKPKNGHTHAHGLEIEQIKRIPVLLEEPVMIMDSVSRNDSIVVVTSEVDRDNCPVIVSIHPNGRGNYEMENVDSNFITSIYGRENFGSFLERVVQTNNLLFCDKVKSQELFSCQGLQSSEAINNLDYDIIIRKSNNIVNIKVDENEEKNATMLKPETKATKKTIR